MPHQVKEGIVELSIYFRLSTNWTRFGYTPYFSLCTNWTRVDTIWLYPISIMEHTNDAGCVMQFDQVIFSSFYSQRACDCPNDNPMVGELRENIGHLWFGGHVLHPSSQASVSLCPSFQVIDISHWFMFMQCHMTISSKIQYTVNSTW